MLWGATPTALHETCLWPKGFMVCLAHAVHLGQNSILLVLQFHQTCPPSRPKLCNTVELHQHYGKVDCLGCVTAWKTCCGTVLLHQPCCRRAGQEPEQQQLEDPSLDLPAHSSRIHRCQCVAVRPALPVSGRLCHSGRALLQSHGPSIAGHRTAGVYTQASAAGTGPPSQFGTLIPSPSPPTPPLQ